MKKLAAVLDAPHHDHPNPLRWIRPEASGHSRSLMGGSHGSAGRRPPERPTAARSVLTVGARCGHDRALAGREGCPGGVDDDRRRRPPGRPEVNRPERAVPHLVDANGSGRDRPLADRARGDLCSLDRPRGDVCALDDSASQTHAAGFALPGAMNSAMDAITSAGDGRPKRIPALPFPPSNLHNERARRAPPVGAGRRAGNMKPTDVATSARGPRRARLSCRWRCRWAARTRQRLAHARTAPT